MKLKIKFLPILILIFIILMTLYTYFALFNQKIDIKYKHELAVINKTYIGDLERSVNLYISYEKFFENADNTPFYVIVPKAQKVTFVSAFHDALNTKVVKKLPAIITDEEVLEACEEPNIANDGYLSQQVVKLCFGATKLSKNYIMIDSDSYFINLFSPKDIFKNGNLKTVSLKVGKKTIKNDFSKPAKYIYGSVFQGYWNKLSENSKQYHTIYNGRNFIKEFFGGGNKKDYIFVMVPFYFSSDNLFRMKQFIRKKGLPYFTYLIKLVPFEMQWYGEYVLRHEKFISTSGTFLLIDDPTKCYKKTPKTKGIIFQSNIYDYKDGSVSYKKNMNTIYSAPDHCN